MIDFSKNRHFVANSNSQHSAEAVLNSFVIKQIFNVTYFKANL